MISKPIPGSKRHRIRSTGVKLRKKSAIFTSLTIVHVIPLKRYYCIHDKTPALTKHGFDSSDGRLFSHTHTKVYLLHSERILQGGVVLDILLRAVAAQRHSQQRRHAEKHCNTKKFLKNHGEEMVGRSRDIVLYIYAFLYSHTSHTLMGRSIMSYTERCRRKMFACYVTTVTKNWLVRFILPIFHAYCSKKILYH